MEGDPQDLVELVMELEMPARWVYVGVARFAVASVARHAGLDEEKVEDLRIAVSEACANAVLGEDRDDGVARAVRIRWHQRADRVILEISDDGSHAIPDPEDSIVGTGRLDMSVGLLRSLVDECAFERRPEGGLTTRLTLLL